MHLSRLPSGSWRVAVKHGGKQRYGVRWMPTWPHVSLGVSVHFDRKFGHLSLHLPVGVLVIGYIGAD